MVERGNPIVKGKCASYSSSFFVFCCSFLNGVMH